jgi:hypothetical protein
VFEKTPRRAAVRSTTDASHGDDVKQRRGRPKGTRKLDEFWFFLLFFSAASIQAEHRGRKPLSTRQIAERLKKRKGMGMYRHVTAERLRQCLSRPAFIDLPSEEFINFMVRLIKILFLFALVKPDLNENDYKKIATAIAELLKWVEAKRKTPLPTNFLEQVHATFRSLPTMEELGFKPSEK